MLKSAVYFTALLSYMFEAFRPLAQMLTINEDKIPFSDLYRFIYSY